MSSGPKTISPPSRRSWGMNEITDRVTQDEIQFFLDWLLDRDKYAHYLTKNIILRMANYINELEKELVE